MPLGEELGLGDTRMVVLPRRHGRILVCGGLVPLVVAGAGIPATAATAGVPQVVVAAVSGGLAVLGSLVLVLGTARSAASARLCVHPGGIVQFARDQPEPYVLRWDDVESVTVSYGDGDDSAPRLDGCVLRARDGTVLSGLGVYHDWVPRWLVAEADRALAPRLSPRLIAAYESGQPVIIGDARIDHAGITVDPVSGSRIAWADMGSVTIRHETSSADTLATVSGIEIRPRSGSTRTLGLDGIPNGILLPHVVAHAAARNGIPLFCSPTHLSDRLAAPPKAPGRDSERA